MNKKDKHHERIHAVFLEHDLLSTSVQQEYHSFAAVVTIEKNVVDPSSIWHHNHTRFKSRAFLISGKARSGDVCQQMLCGASNRYVLPM